MAKRKIKCRKCRKEIDSDSIICMHCGAIAMIKRGDIKSKDLKKYKEI